MGNRLSKIVTKTGDDGTTGISENVRLPKHHPRIHALGDVDELNTTLGVCVVQLRAPLPEGKDDEESRKRPLAVAKQLESIQQHLFNIGGMLSMPELNLLTDPQVSCLDDWIEELNCALPALKEFIVPGGNMGSALLFLAAARARRAERSVVELHYDEPLEPIIIRYINRVSDYLFVAGRYLRTGEGTETLWGNPL